MRTGYPRGFWYRILPHGQTSVSALAPNVRIGVLHSTGKELIDSLLGQAGNGQINLSFPLNSTE